MEIIIDNNLAFTGTPKRYALARQRLEGTTRFSERRAQRYFKRMIESGHPDFDQSGGRLVCRESVILALEVRTVKPQSRN